MHKLLQKRAVDAVNTELNKPTEYAAADKKFKQPDAFKGTEYSVSTRGGLDRNDRVPQEDKMARRRPGALNARPQRASRPPGAKEAFPGFKPDYHEICARALDALHALATATSSEDIRACASMTVLDLEFFMDEERNKPNSAKKADIEMHKAPKFLPPRNDIRTHMDEDLKNEIEADKNIEPKVAGWAQKWKATKVLPKGTILYHGSATSFDADELYSPAFFSDNRKVAERFSWSTESPKVNTIHAYQVTKPIRLPLISSEAEFEQFARTLNMNIVGKSNWMGTEELLEEVMSSKTKIPGWYIPDCYGQGESEVLLMDLGSVVPIEPEGKQGRFKRQ